MRSRRAEEKELRECRLERKERKEEGKKRGDEVKSKCGAQ
jgi:hypothetical protein